MRPFLALLLAIPLSAADLGSRLDQIIDTTGALSHAFVGMRVVRLSDGHVLYARNSERLFVPASNMKLFTTALALSKLGAEYRLSTQIGAEVPIDADGVLQDEHIGDASIEGKLKKLLGRARELQVASEKPGPGN